MLLNDSNLVESYRQRLSELVVMGLRNPFCEGYYRIVKIEYLEIHSNWLNLRVKADWKPLGSKASTELITILISLNKLYSYDSIGPKEQHPELLQGRIIEVKKVEPFMKEINGEQKLDFKVHWSILKSNAATEANLPAFYPEDLEQGDIMTKVTDPKEINNALNSKPGY